MNLLNVQIFQKTYQFAFLAAIFFLPFSIALLEIFLIISFISWAICKLFKNEPLSTHANLTLLLGSFLIISSVSAFFSGYPELSARGLVKLIRYVLIMLLAPDRIKNFKDLKLVAAVLLSSFSVVLLDAIIQRITGADLIRGLKIHYADAQIRLTGPFNFYGLLGAEIICLFPIILGQVFQAAQNKKRFNFFLWFGFCTLSFYILYKTHSRGAWIAAFISWIIFATMAKKRWFLLGLCAIILIVPFVVPKNALIHLDAERKEQSLVERFELWFRAGQVIQKRPLFGCGINTYTKNYPKFDDRKNWRVPGYYAHNGYLQLAAETGLISLGLLLMIFGIALRSGFKVFSNAPNEQKYLILGFYCGFIALLVQITFDTTLHNLQSAVLIWLFAGILIALEDMPKGKEYGNY